MKSVKKYSFRNTVSCVFITMWNVLFYFQLKMAFHLHLVLGWELYFDFCSLASQTYLQSCADWFFFLSLWSLGWKWNHQSTYFGSVNRIFKFEHHSKDKCSVYFHQVHICSFCLFSYFKVYNQKSRLRSHVFCFFLCVRVAVVVFSIVLLEMLS